MPTETEKPFPLKDEAHPESANSLIPYDIGYIYIHMVLYGYKAVTWRLYRDVWGHCQSNG